MMFPPRISVPAVMAFAAITALLLPGPVRAGSATDEFPARVHVEEDEMAPTTLLRTGASSRHFAIFPIYRLAHYTDLPPDSGSLLEPGGIKQMRMVFARDIDGERVRDEFIKSIRIRLTENDWKDIRPSAEKYCAPYAEGEVRKGDHFVVTWLPDGTLISRLNGELLVQLRDPEFARALWSVWLGEKSVVNVDDLTQEWGTTS